MMDIISILIVIILGIVISGLPFFIFLEYNASKKNKKTDIDKLNGGS